jgi:hypothetical protein
MTLTLRIPLVSPIIEATIKNWIDMSVLIVVHFANSSIGYYEITDEQEMLRSRKH